MQPHVVLFRLHPRDLLWLQKQGLLSSFYNKSQPHRNTSIEPARGIERQWCEEALLGIEPDELEFISVSGIRRRRLLASSFPGLVRAQSLDGRGGQKSA